MTETYTQLTLMTMEELVKHEEIIRNGLKTFEKVGTSLAKIRDEEGYKQRGYKTLEAYCLKEFGFGDRHGRRMIAAAQTASNVFKALKQAPASESVARELTSVANDPIVLQKVQAKLEKKKTDIGHASAEAVAEAVASVTGKVKAAPKTPKAEANPALRLALAKANGNGHQSEPATEMRQDLCPHCSHVPDSYVHADEAWRCGNCNGVVTVAISAAIGKTPYFDKPVIKPKVCKTCSQTVPNGAQICPNCGEVAK